MTRSHDSRPREELRRLSIESGWIRSTNASSRRFLMKVCRHIAVVFGIGFVAASAVGDEWTRFRGPNGNSVASEAKHPDQWGEDSNVAWKVKIPGRGWSQPVAAGDKVFVTTAVTEN